jgi:two-component system, NtrC family, sensor kinase
VFHVALRAAHAPLPAAKHAADQSPAVAQVAKARVLVVDDEDMIGMMLRRVLKAHEVTVLTSAREALTQIANGARFDAILCDLMMPVMNGIDFHRTLNQHHPDQAAALIFLTGGAFNTETAAFLASVSNRQLTKPFDVVKLRAEVDAHLSSRRSAGGSSGNPL